MDGKTELDKYNAGTPDPRIHAIIEETGKRAYRVAARKFYMAFKDPSIDHEKYLAEEMKRLGCEDLLGEKQ